MSDIETILEKERWDDVLGQPIEGLLYDLDLEPEQISSERDKAVARVITEMHKRIAALSRLESGESCPVEELCPSCGKPWSEHRLENLGKSVQFAPSEEVYPIDDYDPNCLLCRRAANRPDAGLDDSDICEAHAKAEVKRLRAQLAERMREREAAYNHAEVFHTRLVAAQEAIEDFPAVVTGLVRGYGVDVNEHQIDAWLRDALNRKAQARAALDGKEPK